MKKITRIALRVMMIVNHVVSIFHFLFKNITNAISIYRINYCFVIKAVFSPDSSSKKSCQGCELPSDDIPDSTSNSRGHNNNTPSATNNNSSAAGNSK